MVKDVQDIHVGTLEGLFGTGAPIEQGRGSKVPGGEG